MVILIAGATHAGKTVLAQKILEKYHFPYLSIDHLKMGLIRSGNCPLTPESSDSELTSYLWPIVAEIVKTVIENNQNLIVEGCYIPFDYYKGFDENYLEKIQYRCLVLSEKYINNRFETILQHASDIETRDPNVPTKQQLIDENNKNLQKCLEEGLGYFLVDEKYEMDFVT